MGGPRPLRPPAKHTPTRRPTPVFPPPRGRCLSALFPSFLLSSYAAQDCTFATLQPRAVGATDSPRYMSCHALHAPPATPQYTVSTRFPALGLPPPLAGPAVRQPGSPLRTRIRFILSLSPH